jgi:hypothetical protein
LAVALCICLISCDGLPFSQREPSGAKAVSFAVLEDYDKGADLKEVARDFALMKELGIDVLRCSLGWDDYEPARGHYDFVWLKEFVKLAAQHGIKIRPYIGYTPQWAASRGSADGKAWNNPPADYLTWYRFVYRLAQTLRDYPNVLSYEIYNEQNARLWWDGSIDEYKEALRHAALAIRSADPDAQVILGGFVHPDADWLRSITRSGHARYYDIAAFHAYPETWSEPGVFVENYLDRGYREFVAYNRSPGEGEPVWINEMGFATTAARSERDQANWWARAVSTFLAEPEVRHIGVYEIKDLPLGKDVIGDAKNHYLGITRADRTKKLAFYTVAMLKDLLGAVEITPSGEDVTIIASDADRDGLHVRLFRRSDDRQVLFLWKRGGDAVIRAQLRRGGRSAVLFDLTGRPQPYPAFDGRTLDRVSLAGGDVAIFRIDP